MFSTLIRVMAAAAILGAGATSAHAEPVNYTRVCDAYGSGFYYIPGTDTCVRTSDGAVERRPVPDNGRSVCDQLGLSGLTISDETNCLQIAGRVAYEFNWGDSHIAFSDIRIDVNPGFTLSAPYQRGFLEGDMGSGFGTPALNLDVETTGFQLGVGVKSKLHVDKFAPMDLGLGLEFGYQRGIGSAENVSFPTDIGVPNTGNGILGGYSVGPATLERADLTIDRTFASFDKGLGIPLAGGRFDGISGWPEIDWQLALLGGIRGGVLSERQEFVATTTAGNVDYLTDITGGFFGAYTGLGLSKAFMLPDSDLRVTEDFELAVGFSHYMLHINDAVNGSGALAPVPSSNNYDHSQTIPTFKLGGGIGVGTDTFKAGISAGVTTGYNPPIDIRRPISNVLTPAEVLLLNANMTAYFLFSLRLYPDSR